MMKIIGLTGPSGTGKTTFCQIASDFGIKSIDTDAVYHSLLVPPSPCLDELVLEFGEEILDSEGRLDRPRLASIVFGEDRESKLKKLSQITHKYVLGESRSIIAKADKNGERAIIVDAPALFESGFDKECDLVICLLADKALRRDRIVGRDNISVDRANERILGQREDEFYSSRSKYTIVNDGDLGSIKKSIEDIFSKEGII